MCIAVHGNTIKSAICDMTNDDITKQNVVTWPHDRQHLLFRKTGTIETLANLAKISVWVQASAGSRVSPPEKLLRLNMQNPARLQSSAILAVKWFAMPSIMCF